MIYSVQTSSFADYLRSMSRTLFRIFNILDQNAETCFDPSLMAHGYEKRPLEPGSNVAFFCLFNTNNFYTTSYLLLSFQTPRKPAPTPILHGQKIFSLSY